MDETIKSSPTEAGSRFLEPTVASVGSVLARIEPVLAAVDELRLQADRDRLLALQLAGFKGPALERFERDLVSYGDRVLPAMIRKGSIFGAMVKLGLPVADDCRLRPGLTPGPEDAFDLARETMAIALPRFRESLTASEWDGSREHVTSLDSFFIGRCALNFRGPWRRWLRACARQARVVTADPSDARLHGEHQDDDVDRVGGRVDLQRALESLPHKQRVLLVLDACDLTDQEIGDRLGISPRAVEGKLRRLRQNLERVRDERYDTA